MGKQGTDAKCTFGLRPPVDQVTLNAQIDREIRNFRVYDRYMPQFRADPVTGKFYARHDNVGDQDPETKARVDDYFRRVELARAKGPKDKFPRPALESHE